MTKLIIPIFAIYNTGTVEGCGDNYWLLHRFSGSSPCVPFFQRAHPYTAFQNWDEKNDHIWNVGFIINANPEHKQSWSSWLMGRKTSAAETSNHSRLGVVNPMYQNDNYRIELTSFSTKDPSEPTQITNINNRCQQAEFHIRSWGPYRSSFYAVDLCDTYSDIVLIAAGSGFGYILSAITILGEKHQFGNDSDPEKNKKITVLFSARQIEVIGIFTELLTQVPNFRSCEFHIRFTGNKNRCLDDDENSVELSNLNTDDFFGIEHFEKFDQSKLNFGTGRLDLKQILAACDQKETALACVCGSGSLIEAVKKECRKNGIRLRVEEI